MKKISWSLLVILTTLVACSKTDVKIQGTTNLEKLNGSKIYLTEVLEKNTIDSTVIEKGKFTFKGQFDKAKLLNISIENQEISRPIVWEKGTIQINIAGDDDISVTGTANNDSLSSFVAKNKELSAEYENAMKISEEATNKVGNKFIDLGYSTTKNNPRTVVGQYAFLSYYWGMSIEQREELIPLFDEEFKENSKVKKIISVLDNEKKTSVGQHFTDFTINDIEGNPVTLSDLIGKSEYLLIDFWASWCGPCIKSLPSVKALYDKQNRDKFDIIGVSLDKEKENWVNAVKKFDLKWTQVSDLKEWESQGAKLYAVSFIPTTILIDKEGTIIGRNMHINEIEDILNK